eukprot:CAMPEP_0114128060 /NCGR_PEP_ID=MMETSP0043_2-20121206/10727_1 /TAXON_ID=464988 /ORGANISM="Hemiselmis andersenii, Strain CCMP644" /LENGTH=243 /DNA_ID=CAMNT_0001221217 /DNA_START=175 /DNA_END=906 /DNA_ORIENTATION=-
MAAMPYAACFSIPHIPLSSSSIHRAPSITCVADTPRDSRLTLKVSRSGFLGLGVGAAAAAAASRPEEALAVFDGPATDWYRPEGEDGVVPKYDGQEWKGPVWPKPADEPSIPWSEFIQLLAAGEIVVVDFVGKNGDKVYCFRKGDTERIRIGEGLPNETEKPPPSGACKECLEGCPPEDKSCSCLSACGGSNDWNSPLYTARTIRNAKVPFRYSREDNKEYGNVVNLWRKWVMFDGPISAGVI